MHHSNTRGSGFGQFIWFGMAIVVICTGLALLIM
jgi:hypothetical protein